MFKLLRSRAKIFYWVIAASFILFIFLAWGMDFTSGRGGPRGEPDVVGSVNGAPISILEWNEAYQNYLARMRQQNPEQTLTPNQHAQAREQVWQYFLRDRIEAAEIARLGLTATHDEILDILKNNPPPELLAQYRDESGQPNLSAYLADLANPNRDWRGVEIYLQNQLPRQKLQQMIASRAVITDAELREAWVRQLGRAVAEYVGALAADIKLEGEPTEEEIAAFHREHLSRYERPARARLTVVAWRKTPSENDRAEVRALAQDIKQEIEAGEISFQEAAAIYSQDPTRERGGDLGVFDRQRMVPPFTAAAFALPVGRISEPVETDFGVHLIEVLEQFQEGGEVARVHARHILLQIEPGEGTLGDIYDRAEQFLAAAAKRGFAAAAAASADSVEILTPEPVGEGRDVPGLPNTQQGVQFALTAKPGAQSRVFETDDVYYAVQADGLIPAGPAPVEEVRAQIVAELNQRRQRELAAQKLAPAAAAIRGGESFASAAARFGLVHAVTDTFRAADNIPRVGYGTAFNAAAIEAPLGQLIPLVETPRGAFALRTLWKQPLSDAEFALQKEMVRAQLLGRRQYESLEAWYAQQIARAKIVDNRQALLGGGA